MLVATAYVGRLDLRRRRSGLSDGKQDFGQELHVLQLGLFAYRHELADDARLCRA